METEASQTNQISNNTGLSQQEETSSQVEYYNQMIQNGQTGSEEPSLNYPDHLLLANIRMEFDAAAVAAGGVDHLSIPKSLMDLILSINVEGFPLDNTSDMVINGVYKEKEPIVTEVEDSIDVAVIDEFLDNSDLMKELERKVRIIEIERDRYLNELNDLKLQYCHVVHDCNKYSLEIEYLKEQCKDIENEYNYVFAQIDNYKSKLEHRNTQVKTLMEIINNTTDLENRYLASLQQNVNLKVQLEVVQRELNTAIDNNSNMNNVVATINNDIEQLTEELASKEETIDKMASKLVKFKSRIEEMESDLLRFYVKKVYKFYPDAEAQIIIRQVPNGQIYMDVVVSGKRTSYPIESIEKITPVSRSRFTVTYRDNSSDTFYSMVRDDLIVSINEYIIGTNNDV
eukprot:TRINITY_DN1673_c0_g1_i1.p1 TRINITY_DN1673_c0_g1~~TRINITY_DN1673_c0_g1_i1.p1  ORF type:complete len:400 (+),score=90.70 TRINITY_DN1673_c0_g1_i1:31-1230(+)